MDILQFYSNDLIYTVLLMEYLTKKTLRVSPHKLKFSKVETMYPSKNFN